MNIIKPFENHPSEAHVMGTAKYLHGHVILAVTANSIIGSLIAFLLWESNVPSEWLTAWWVFLLCICALRLAAYFVFQFGLLPNKSENFWVGVFSSFAIVSAVIWGTASFFIQYVDIYQHAIVITLITGVAVGALPMLAPVKWIYHLFVFISLVPMSLALVLYGNSPQLILGLLGGFLMFCLYRSGDLLFGVLEKLRFEAQVSHGKALQIESLLIKLRAERDIAKRAAESATIAKCTAEQANKEKSRFLAAASHDLRQPLHALGLFVHAMEPHVDSNGKEIFENINATLQCTEELFNSLLDISKLEAGVASTSIRHFTIQSVFDKLYARYCAEAVCKQLAFKVKSSNYVINTDPYYFEQVIGNLISNAIKYTKKGAILVGCRYRGDFVEIEVRDSGVGINAEDHGVIFDEFVQLGNSERDRRNGLGLGLAIVNHICRLLGFGLDLVSEPNVGSVFKVKIPLGDPRLVEQSLAPTLIYSDAELEGVKVLLIEDERDICKAMTDLLHTWGGECFVADNMKDASMRYDLKNENRPDIVISDLRLAASLNGIDEIVCLRKYLGENIPAVIVSGDTAPEILREVESRGFVLLHKPIMPPRFRMLLKHLLKLRETSEV